MAHYAFLVFIARVLGSPLFTVEVLSHIVADWWNALSPASNLSAV